MINSLTVTNHIGESIDIVLGNLDKSGFLITNIDGISPPKATINSTDMVLGDGCVVNSTRLESRNIVIYITFDNRYDVEKLRLKLYRYFPIKKEISLNFKTGKRSCEVKGYVESNQVEVFSQSQSAQVSILCSDPYFYDTGDNAVTTTAFSSIESVFEFPFSNESLSEPLLEFGVINISRVSNVYYNGDADVGVHIIIKVNGRIGNIVISKVGTNSVMTIDHDRLVKILGSDLKLGDEIHIHTMRNGKRIEHLRKGIYTNILNSLDRHSTWFTLERGNNLFSYDVEGGIDLVYFTIENQTLYEGV